jgi:hypothetical protein
MPTFIGNREAPSIEVTMKESLTTIVMVLCAKKLITAINHHRKPRINPIEDANRRVNAKDFNITKGIPHLTRQHILAWCYRNNSDEAQRCSSSSIARRIASDSETIRLNCYNAEANRENPNRCNDS